MVHAMSNSVFHRPPSQSFVSPRRLGVCAHAVPDRSRNGNAKIRVSIPGGLAILLTTSPAWAEVVDSPAVPAAQEIANQVPTPSGTSGGILDLFADNPILIAGLALLAAVPLAFSFLQGGALGVKQVNASGAVEGLSSDPSTVLIDIRNSAEVKEQGSPNLSSTKKKAIVLPFTKVVKGEVQQDEQFSEKFGKLKQIKPETSIIILDSFGEEAPKAAKALAAVVDRVYYVKDGAVGPSGWKTFSTLNVPRSLQESGEPWREPAASFIPSLNLDSLASDFKEQPTVVKGGLALGALGVGAAVLFQEVGTAVELAALAAAGVLVLPRFLDSSGPASSDDTKRQVKQFVEDTSKDPQKAAGKAEKSAAKTGNVLADKAKDVGEEVQSLVSGDSKAKAKGKATEIKDDINAASGKSNEEASEVASQAADAVNEVAEGAEKRVEEAKSWINDWKKDQD